MTEDLVRKYQRSLSRADVTRRRVEGHYASGTLIERDVLSVYEGLFLRAVVGFEDLLESVFFAVLNGRSSRREWKAKVSGNRRDIRKCVFDQRHYLDWLPYKHTIGRAKLYLRGGLPFTSLDDGDRSKLSQIVIIRNAIAHSSEFALATFREKVIDATPLAKKERRPAGYLRGFSSRSTRRYEVFVQSLGGIANKLH